MYAANLQYPSSNQQQTPTDYNTFNSNSLEYQAYGYVPPQVLQQNSTIIVAYSDISSRLRHNNELQKIDFDLHNEFSCYVCWVWFCFICTVIGGVTYTISGDQGEDIGLYIVIVLNYLLGFTGFLFGLIAISKKSSHKNDIFKKLLLLYLGICLIAFILDLATPSTCIYTDIEYNEETNESYLETYNCNNDLPIIVITFIMYAIVYYNSNSYGKALKKRERFLNEH